MSHLASHGRGGAGNMADASQSPKVDPADLKTPTLKTPIVTTGRGGTGNMAKNTDPKETRLRQDVEAVARRPSAGAQHAGRGGAGNVFKNAGADADLESKQSDEKAVVDDDGESNNSGDADKAKKRWLFGGKKA